MELKRFYDIDKFLEIAKPTLLANEVENNLILGVSLHIKSNPEKYKEKYLAVISKGDDINAICVCTLPHKLLFWGKADNCKYEMTLLINDILLSKLEISGVLCSSLHASQFAEIWQDKTGQPFRKGMSERIYKIEKVSFPKVQFGKMRLATNEDLELVCKWMQEFQNEAVPDDPMTDFEEFARKKIENEDLVIWEDDEPVSLASRARPTVNGITINLVYTPIQFRKRGYASALVAHLCQTLLTEGWKFCTLFTDLSNPTSNSIYQKVGFKPVCDFQEYYFGEPIVEQKNLKFKTMSQILIS